MKQFNRIKYYIKLINRASILVYTPVEHTYNYMQHDKDLMCAYFSTSMVKTLKEYKIKGLRRFDNALSTAVCNSEKED